MNSAQLPFLVEGILILVCMVFGTLLGRAGKPYGRVKLITHIFLFAWLTTGFGFTFYGLLTMNGSQMIWIPMSIFGLTILIQLVTGIIMMVSRSVGKSLPMIHLGSAILMILSDISALGIAMHGA